MGKKNFLADIKSFIVKTDFVSLVFKGYLVAAEVEVSVGCP